MKPIFTPATLRPYAPSWRQGTSEVTGRKKTKAFIFYSSYRENRVAIISDDVFQVKEIYNKRLAY